MELALKWSVSRPVPVTGMIDIHMRKISAVSERERKCKDAARNVLRVTGSTSVAAEHKRRSSFAPALTFAPSYDALFRFPSFTGSYGE